MSSMLKKIFSIQNRNKKSDSDDDKKKTRRGVKAKRNKNLEAISKSFAGDSYEK